VKERSEGGDTEIWDAEKMDAKNSEAFMELEGDIYRRDCEWRMFADARIAD
jgi:hypothetical protein